MTRINFAIIGPGKISHRFVLGVKHSLHAHIIAVGARDQKKAAVYANQYDIEHAGSIEDVLRLTEVDCVYISTPPASHKQLILQSLAAGKHVICEKPMLYHVEDVEEVFTFAKEKGLFLMEGQKGLFLPTTAKMKEWIEQGILGKVQYIEASYSYRFASSLDHWVFDPTIGGGGSFDVGGYPLSLVLSLIKTPVVDVHRNQVSMSTGVDGFASLRLQFEEGCIANIQAGIDLPMKNTGRIYGTEGYIFIDDFWKTNTVTYHRYDGASETFTIEQPSEFTYYIDHSCECIKKGLLESPIHPKSSHRLFTELLNQSPAISST